MPIGQKHTDGSQELGLTQWDLRALTGLPAGVVTGAGQALRYARRWAGLSQRDLASRAECSQSRIARIESGRVVPRTDFLEGLLSLCGLTLRQHMEPSGRSERAKTYRRKRQLVSRV